MTGKTTNYCIRIIPHSSGL